MSDAPTVPRGLRYGSDAEPGIRRRGTKRFEYRDERTGRPPGKQHLERIRKLAIPPAWTDVWIAAFTRQPRPGDRARRPRAASSTATTPSSRRADRPTSSPTSPRSVRHLGSLRRRVRHDLREPGRRPRPGHRRCRPPARRHRAPRGQRGVRPHEPDVRTDDAAPPPRHHAAVSTIRLTFKGKVAKEFDVSIEDATTARLVRRCPRPAGPGAVHLPHRQRTRSAR